MITSNGKRSSNNGMDPDDQASDGVGGRQADGPTDQRGGGYLDICNEKKHGFADPRRADLVDLVPDHWLAVADQIGVDNFLLTWQLLSENDSIQDNFGRVHIPNFSAWLRYQRNRLISTLARRGDSAQDIHETLKKRLGYDLSFGHIRDLMKQ